MTTSKQQNQQQQQQQHIRTSKFLSKSKSLFCDKFLLAELKENIYPKP
jgi:hypothetical protein